MGACTREWSGHTDQLRLIVWPCRQTALSHITIIGNVADRPGLTRCSAYNPESTLSSLDRRVSQIPYQNSLVISGTLAAVISRRYVSPVLFSFPFPYFLLLMVVSPVVSSGFVFVTPPFVSPSGIAFPSLRIYSLTNFDTNGL